MRLLVTVCLLLVAAVAQAQAQGVHVDTLDLAVPGSNGGGRLELFSFPNPPARVSRPEACGLRHLAMTVQSVEAARDYVLFHTATRSHIHRISMGALEQLLDPQQLMRVHRSTFIRPALVKAVRRLGKGLISLEMEDGAVVQVGPTYVKAVLERLGLP